MIIKIDESKLDRVNAQQVEQSLTESFVEQEKLTGFAREVALNVTIPIAKFCELAGPDGDTRYQAHEMLMRAIVLGWAHHIENHIKPEGIKGVCGILETWFHQALMESVEMLEEGRMQAVLDGIVGDIGMIVLKNEEDEKQ